MALRGGAAEDDTVVGLTPWIRFIPDSTGTMRSAADPKASVGGDTRGDTQCKKTLWKFHSNKNRKRKNLSL